MRIVGLLSDSVPVQCLTMFDTVLLRKNHARAMDSIQASMDSEQRAKSEALRIKKKLEGDLNSSTSIQALFLL